MSPGKIKGHSVVFIQNKRRFMIFVKDKCAINCIAFTDIYKVSRYMDIVK